MTVTFWISVVLISAAVAISEWGDTNTDMTTWAFWRHSVALLLAFLAGGLQP